MKNSTIRRNILMFTVGGGLLAYGIQRLFSSSPRPTAQKLLQKQLQDTFNARFLIAPGKPVKRITPEEEWTLLGELRQRIDSYNADIDEQYRGYPALQGDHRLDYDQVDTIIRKWKQNIEDYNKQVEEYNRLNQ